MIHHTEDFSCLVAGKYDSNHGADKNYRRQPHEQPLKGVERRAGDGSFRIAVIPAQIRTVQQYQRCRDDHRDRAQRN